MVSAPRATMSSRRGWRQLSLTTSVLDHATEDVAQLDDPGRDEQDHERDAHQHYAHRGAEPPVEPLLDLRHDDLADHLVLEPAEQGRRDVEPERQDEHQQAA